MDGRTQLPAIDFLQKRFGVDFVDTISEPGPNGILALGQDATVIDSIFSRVDISVGKHGSKAIAIVGHHDCGGNPGPKEKQLADLEKAYKLVKARYPSIEVIKLWIDESWEVFED